MDCLHLLLDFSISNLSICIPYFRVLTVVRGISKGHIFMIVLCEFLDVSLNFRTGQKL